MYSRSFLIQIFICPHTNTFSRGSSESTLDEGYLYNSDFSKKKSFFYLNPSKNKLLGKNDIFFWLRKINFGKTVLFNSDFPLTLEKNAFFSIEFVVEQVLRKNRCFFDPSREIFEKNRSCFTRKSRKREICQKIMFFSPQNDEKRFTNK